ncbi:Protein FANTASTIC FOUR 3 [Linum grandiflorum]
MAACNTFQHIFDKPLLKPPAKPPLDQSSFTELFGELHFKETTNSHASPSSLLDSFSANLKPNPYPPDQTGGSISKLGDGSLQLCTEGLGSESFADNEDISADWKHDEEKRRTRSAIVKHSALSKDFRRSRSGEEGFPPPISCISQTGKPWVCFKSSRQDGRFVLTEVKFPAQEFLHACRENGRLTLKFVHHDNEIDEQDEEHEQPAE